MILSFMDEYQTSSLTILSTILTWISLGSFFETTRKFSFFYRIVDGVMSICSKLVFLSLIYFVGLSFFSSTVFYHSPYFRDFTTAFRSQFALMFNDALYPIYRSALKDINSYDIWLVIIYMIMNWIFFVGIILRIAISIVGTTFHYTKFKFNIKESQEKMTIKKFLDDEFLKKTIDANHDFEELEELEEKKANILASLNHIALEQLEPQKVFEDDAEGKVVTVANYAKMKALIEYKKKLDTEKSKKIFSEIILEDANHLKFYKKALQKQFYKANQVLADVYQQLTGGLGFELSENESVREIANINLARITAKLEALKAQHLAGAIVEQ